MCSTKRTPSMKVMKVVFGSVSVYSLNIEYTCVFHWAGIGCRHFKVHTEGSPWVHCAALRVYHGHTVGTRWAHGGHTVGTRWAHRGYTVGTPRAHRGYTV